MGSFRCHSGATYPLVPLMPVKVLVWSGFSSFANPKSEIFARPTPLAMSRAIPILSSQQGCFSGVKSIFASDPLLMYSYTKSL
ncbi:hypothetical protein I3843_03G121500 [Carya illinoinensis]|nr:hypothetical protein I3843_03G121500 [Carya illinoinensis]